MRDRASLTALWVAMCRSFGVLLPEPERLIDDPYGARFAGTTGLLRTPALTRALFPKRAIEYMQVRTLFIDDALLDFVRSGGRQIVILGAGFDCRALRFAHELAKAAVFEIDHPATQARKRDVLRHDVGAKTEYIAWDFEKRSMSDLPAALGASGHDARKPSFTIWEGVTMYLTEPAIDASVLAVRDYSARGSQLAFTYMDRAAIERPDVGLWLGRRVVALIGEPFRFGFDPAALPEWLRARGFAIERDATMTELGHQYLGAASLLHRGSTRHIAIARIQVT